MALGLRYAVVSDAIARTYAKTTHGLLLLLGLGRLTGGGRALRLSSVSGGLAIGFGLADLAGDGLAAAATRPLLEALLLLLLVLLLGRLGHLHNEGATVELLLVEELDGLLCGLGGGEGDKSIAGRAVAAALNDLSGDAAGWDGWRVSGDTR